MLSKEPTFENTKHTCPVCKTGPITALCRGDNVLIFKCANIACKHRFKPDYSLKDDDTLAIYGIDQDDKKVYVLGTEPPPE